MYNGVLRKICKTLIDLHTKEQRFGKFIHELFNFIGDVIAPISGVGYTICFPTIHGKGWLHLKLEYCWLIITFHSSLAWLLLCCQRPPSSSSVLACSPGSTQDLPSCLTLNENEYFRLPFSYDVNIANTSRDKHGCNANQIHRKIKDKYGRSILPHSFYELKFI